MKYAQIKNEASYPITYQSWVIVYARQADFAPLPRSLRDKAMKQLDKIAVK